MPLTKRLVHPTLLFFKFTALLGIFPLNVDLRTHKISPNKSIISKPLHSIFSFVMILRGIHYMSATLDNLINFKAAHFPEVIISVTACWFTLTAALWNYEIFHRAPNTFIILFNDMDHDNPDYRSGVSRRRAFAWQSPTPKMVRGRLLRHLRLTSKYIKLKFHELAATMKCLNLQEAVVVFSPFSTILVVQMYLAIMYFFPHWSLFLLSLIPADWRVGWVVVVVVVWETFTAAAGIFSVVVVCFLCMRLQAFYFRQLDRKIGQLRSIVSSSGQHHSPQLRRIHQWFRAYYVMIKLCNVFFRRILFTGKLLAMTMVISSTFYVISHASKGLTMLLGLFAFLAAWAMVFWYTATAELFRIPAKMNRIKYLFLLALHKNTQEGKLLTSEEEAMKMDVEAIENVGISEGGFRKMESISLLVFINFVLNQVIALLLAFPLDSLE